MNIRQNFWINLGIPGLGQPNPKIPGLEKWARIAFPTHNFPWVIDYSSIVCRVISPKGSYTVTFQTLLFYSTII